MVPTIVRAFALTAALLLCMGTALGQRSGNPSPSPPTGGTPPAGNPGGGGRGGTPGNQTPNGPNRTDPTQNTNPQPTRPIFVSGRVQTDDGSELPHDIAIERVCGGLPRIESHTDSKGYFSFELGDRSVDALQDASTGPYSEFGNQNSTFGTVGAPTQQLINCELRARAAGYQSQSADLTTLRMENTPDVGTILLHRIARTEGTTVSATTLAAPKDARKALQKGLDQERKNRPDEALSNIQRAVEIYPKYAEAWFHLGRLQAANNRFDDAHHSFDESIRSDPQFVLPYVQISLLELTARRWQELADVTDKATKLDPFSFPQAFLLNAIAHYNLNQVDAAESSARRAERLDTRHQFPQISHLLGTILARKRDFGGAAAKMREYLQFAPHARDATAVQSQVEAWEKEISVSTPAQP